MKKMKMPIATKEHIAVATAPRLVRNNVPDDHLKALDGILARASNIAIAVAFLKSKGLGKIVKRLTRRLSAGALVEMFVGTDFCQTELARFF